MKAQPIPIILLAALLSLILAACSYTPFAPAAAAPTEVTAPAAEPQAEETQPEASPEPAEPDEGTPEWVAVRFFEAYLDTLEKMEPTLGNPEFTAQQYLSDEYIRQVAEIKAGFEGARFDPILHAQEWPPKPVEVAGSQIDGEQATVVVQFGRGLLTEPWKRIISLAQIDGEWKIVPDRVEGGALSPEETVQAFYDWYTGYIGSGEQMRNPLVDQAYRAAPYLTGEMIARVDQMVQAGELIADPLLCAQDVPAEIYPLASFDNGSRPIVVMGTSFAGHTLVADLVRSDFNTYAIRKITCGSSPAGLAKAFYTWAIDYMTGSGEFRNLLVDGAHRESPFLSQDFVRSLDERLSSEEPLMADPIFHAQDLPQAINAAACPDEDCAYIHMQFGDSNFRQLRLDLVMEAGQLRIDNITHPRDLEAQATEGEIAGVTHWVPFTDEPYGYALRYPAGWQVSVTPVSDLHTPDEYSVMRLVTFEPPNQSEWPVGYSLEVRVESEENFAMLHPETDKVDEIEINGVTATVYRSDPGILAYAFRHPTLENTWVVLNDSISQFPGREALAEATAEAFQSMLGTIVLQ